MKKENKDFIIIIVTIIVIGPLVFIYRLPWIIKALFRYFSDKSNLPFSEYLTTVRRHSKSFNKSWREAAAKGIHAD